MRTSIIAAVVSLTLSACAILPTAPPSETVQHQFTLPATGANSHGLRVTQGPLTLLQVIYVPLKGEGTALLWTSADGSCPPVGPVLAFGTLTKYAGWYGAQPVKADEFLCASHDQNETDATLTWITAKVAATSTQP